MTRARDISNVITDANLGGTLDVSGAFTSNGIDDNADAIAITIDSSERVMIGTTTEGNTSADNFTIADTSHAGITIRSGTSSSGAIYFSDGTSGSDEFRGFVNYAHGTNAMTFGTDASERMRIDSSGNVMIGETSQINGGKLNIATSAEGSVLSMLCRSTTDSHQPEIVMQKSSTDSGNFVATADGESLGSIKFRGVNTSAVSDIGAEISVVQDGTSSSTVPTTMRFSTNETERMRIDSSGDTFINTTSDPTPFTAKFCVVGTGNVLTARTTSSSGSTVAAFQTGSYDGGVNVMNFYNNSGGTMGRISATNGLNGTSVSFNTSSDYRLKENVSYNFDATTRLKQLKPARFNFIADETNTTVDGFLAHEVSDIVPEAITGEKDAVDADGNIDPQGIDQSKLVPLLTKTLQEALTRIDTLEAEVKELKGE